MRRWVIALFLLSACSAGTHTLGGSDAETADGGTPRSPPDTGITVEAGGGPGTAEAGVVPTEDAGFCHDDLECAHPLGSSPCEFAGSKRTCPIGAVCAMSDGCGYCACQPDDPSEPGSKTCSVCTYSTSASPGLPTSCTSSQDCPGGACIFDEGCSSHGWCSIAPCSATMMTPANYCGCDGVTFTALCPERPYAHVGPCP